MAVTSTSATLVLRYADVGVATYGSLRVVGRPDRTVTWVVSEPLVLAALDVLADAMPEPRPGESGPAALERALTTGPFTDPAGELAVAYTLGALLISADAWQLLVQSVSDPRATLFVAPTAKLACVPWGLVALPTVTPSPEMLVVAQAQAMTRSGPVPAQVPWLTDDIASRTEGLRLMELVDVLWAIPANVARSPRSSTPWCVDGDGPAVLVLDPRVPGQRPDSPLGSVLGRPASDTALSQHFQRLMRGRPILPEVAAAVELFRRTDVDRGWLAAQLTTTDPVGPPSRLLYVGHASAADGDLGYADRAALHLACTAGVSGDAEPIGDHRPLTASDLISARLPIPPRVALLACASGGDYRFDEATGLVAAMVLGGAQLVTATLWSLPTSAGYRAYRRTSDAPTGPQTADPMAGLVTAVDAAHEEDEAGRGVNRWQRGQMRRWRDGDTSASPLYWAALATFSTDGAR